MIKDYKKYLRFYNHGLFPNFEIYKSLPSEIIMSNEIWDKTIWGRTPYFLYYISEFGTNKKTNWWYTVLDHPVTIDKLNSKQRYKVKKALEFCYCKEINSKEYNIEMINIAKEVSKSYKRHKQDVYDYSKKKYDVIGCFLKENDALIGFCIINKVGDMIDKVSEKCLHFDDSKIQPSTVLSWYIIENYINSGLFKLISNGSRTLNHMSLHNDFLIERFNYKRIYCKLHIVLNPKYKFFIRVAYLFRIIFKLFDKISYFHALNSFLLIYRISKES